MGIIRGEQPRFKSQFFMPPSSRIVTAPTARLNSSTPVSSLPSTYPPPSHSP
ncbi:hypothetical protein BC829DRAFT_383253 [Chytridium lagenaria]|nr:hypothetical protein BC829DRAFT_383253 [Chytridium lagenaria]